MYLQRSQENKLHCSNEIIFFNCIILDVFTQNFMFERLYFIFIFYCFWLITIIIIYPFINIKEFSILNLVLFIMLCSKQQVYWKTLSKFNLTLITFQTRGGSSARKKEMGFPNQVAHIEFQFESFESFLRLENIKTFSSENQKWWLKHF